MKRWMIIVLSLVLTFVLVSPVFAAGPQTGKGQSFATLSGKIVALDAAAGKVTVHVLAGSRLAKTYIGTDVTLATTASTRILYNNGTTTVVITFAGLKVGDSVSATAGISGGVLTATRITVGAKLIHY